MKHLKENNETYFEHMKHAQTISWTLFTMSIKCFVHSIHPELFKDGVSSKVEELKNLVFRGK
tara:strand:+ start:309 stop:494 length:186 start_codon:yes stop_codon:yes gene_type:complete